MARLDPHSRQRVHDIMAGGVTPHPEPSGARPAAAVSRPARSTRRRRKRQRSKSRAHSGCWQPRARAEQDEARRSCGRPSGFAFAGSHAPAPVGTFDEMGEVVARSAPIGMARG
ncbi:hypothetical protein FNF27_08335 [Cafeteria roenbergensis]|uniref:Uncharacterized protein n=1 Tax=Cafeteria roenbergensis TaxID=33653 RepID=A0A5A8D350_CAFRO|nr:hypothetical protein FNF27_08335 [Cafeteria roenbergensis]